MPRSGWGKRQADKVALGAGRSEEEMLAMLFGRLKRPKVEVGMGTSSAAIVLPIVSTTDRMSGYKFELTMPADWNVPTQQPVREKKPAPVMEYEMPKKRIVGREE